MALTLAQLTAARDSLVEARASGLREYRDSNGEQVRYGSDREMAAALAFLDRQIAELSGRPAPHSITFRTSKGT